MVRFCKAISFFRSVWLIFVGLLLIAPEVPAQTVTLRGFITDHSSGQALEGANIILRDTDGAVYGATSNQDGFYQVGRIPAGSYPVTVSYIGYISYLDTLTLGSDLFVTLSVALTPSREELGEVVIESGGGATRMESGGQRIRPTDLQRIPTPAASGDLASYLQVLPGVVSLGDRGGQLFIRGGTPSQNLVLVDGMLIYQPFHIVGFFSAFPQDLVSGVDMYAGGFGARYSGRISSVIDVTMRNGNNQRFQGGVSASPFLTGVRIEGPLSRGSVSFLTSVRSSVIEHTSPGLLGTELPLKFSDVLFKLQGSGMDNVRWSITGMRTFDRGRIDTDRDEDFRWGNTVVGWRWLSFAPASSMLVEFNGGFSYFSNAVGIAGSPQRSSDAWRINTAVQLSKPFDKGKLAWGLYGRSDRMNYSLGEELQSLSRDSELLITGGAYLTGEVTFAERLDIIPGLVLNVPLDMKPGIEPRLRVNWRPWGTEAQVLHAALGLYRQEAEGISDERDAGSMFTAWMINSLDNDRARAVHALLGWQQQVGIASFFAEAYFKDIDHLPVPIWSQRARFTNTLTSADGKSYGLDTRLELDRKPLYAYLGYGWSWTKYITSQDNFGLWFGEPIQQYHPPHDRRHQINAVLSLQLGKFEVSTRWQYGSGLPYTQADGFDVLVDLLGRPDVRKKYGIPRLLFDRPYAARLPAYHRLDVSAERSFDLKTVKMAIQAGAINLYNRENLFYFDLFRLRRVNQLPFLPYVSVLVESR